jgi:hypothetical protein
MTTITKWLNNPYVLGFLLVAGAIADLVLWGFAADLNKSEWASWVQGIGTIGAIAAAFLVANFQLKQAKRLEEARAVAEERRRYQIVRALFENASIRATEMAGATARGDAIYFAGLNWTSLSDLRAALVSIQVMDVPSAALILRISAVSTALEALVAPFRHHAQVGYNHDTQERYEWLVVNHVEFRIEELVEQAKEAMNECDRFLEQLGCHFD